MVKLKPKLNQQFEVTRDEAILSVKFENDSINLYYKTPFSSYKETLISIDEKHLTVLNETGATYKYKRYISPFENLEE